MRRACSLLLLLTGMVGGCAAPPWSWQDLRTPPRTDAAEDLAACRSYAAAQYTPGLPAGDAYQQAEINYRTPAPATDGDQQPKPGTGTWHPDREPFPYINRDQQSQHDVVVPYTGYPGYLDYHPGYLDALVEKCMQDRGWRFLPTAPPPASTASASPDRP